MIQHGERGGGAEYRADPDDAERTGADHGGSRRPEGVTAAAHDARRDLIQAAHRFKQQDTQDADGGAVDDRPIGGKQTGAGVAEQHDRKDRDRAADR